MIRRAVWFAIGGLVISAGFRLGVAGTLAVTIITAVIGAI